MHFQSMVVARRAACSWRVWRSGERRGAAVGGVALWRRCGCAGRGASLRPAAAAHGEEVRALAHERSDAEAGSWCDAMALTRCALAPMR